MSEFHLKQWVHSRSKYDSGPADESLSLFLSPPVPVPLSCGDCNPLRDTFPVQRPGQASRSGTPPDPGGRGGGGGEEAAGRGVALLYSEEAGTQIVSMRPSLPDYCFLSLTSDGPPLVTEPCPGPGAPSWGVRPVDGPAGAGWEVTVDDHEQQPLSSASSENDHTPDSTTDSIPDPPPDTPPDHLRALTVLAVNGTLWIPRWAGVAP